MAENQSFGTFAHRFDELLEEITPLMATLDMSAVLPLAKKLSETYEEINTPAIRSLIADHFCRRRFPEQCANWLRALTNQGIANMHVLKTIVYLLRVHWRLTDASHMYCKACCLSGNFKPIIKHYIGYELYPEGAEYAQPVSKLIHAVLAIICNISRHHDLCPHFSVEVVKKALIRHSQSESPNQEIPFKATIDLCFLAEKEDELVLEKLTSRFRRLVAAFQEALVNPQRIVNISNLRFRGRFSVEELSGCLRVATTNRLLGAFFICECDLLEIVRQYSNVDYAGCLPDLTKILENLLSYSGNRDLVIARMDVVGFLNNLEEHLALHYELWAIETRENIHKCRNRLNIY